MLAAFNQQKGSTDARKSKPCFGVEGFPVNQKLIYLCPPPSIPPAGGKRQQLHIPSLHIGFLFFRIQPISEEGLEEASLRPVGICRKTGS
jgi:hypothetical protein